MRQCFNVSMRQFIKTHKLPLPLCKILFQVHVMQLKVSILFFFFVMWLSPNAQINGKQSGKVVSYNTPSNQNGNRSTEYFVSVSGDNSNPGTYQLPWKDINYACNNATAGSTVNVMQGTYFEQVSVGVDSITIQNYQNQNVIIDGTGVSTGAMVEISNKQGVTFDGFELQNNIHNDAQGILITGKSSNTTIKNCKIHDIHFSANPNDPINENTNSQPLIVFGDSTTPLSHLNIINNEIYNCRLGFSEALAVNGNVDTFNIIGNSVHDVTNIGIVMIGHEQTCSDPAKDQARNGVCKENITYKCSSPYAANGGIYIDGARDIVIERNSCYQNIWGIEVGCEHTGKTASGITVKNNAIYRNAKSGIALGGYDYPSGSGKIVNCIFYNNTLYDNDTLNDYEAEINITYAENCSVTNNIVYGTNIDNLLIIQYSSVAPVNVVLDSNLYYDLVGAVNVEFEWQNTSYTGFSSWQAAGHDSHTIFNNPDFADVSAFPPDLHLSATSPAIDAASDCGLIMDRDSVPRPLLNANDMGAYEYGIYWKGTLSNDWSNSGNWSNNTVPDSTDKVTIPSPGFYNHAPQISSNVQVSKIYIKDSSNLEVNSGAVLTVGE